MANPKHKPATWPSPYLHECRCGIHFKNGRRLDKHIRWHLKWERKNK